MAYKQPSSGPFKMMGSSTFKKDKLPLDGEGNEKKMPTSGVNEELSEKRAENDKIDRAITKTGSVKRKKAYQAALEEYYTKMEESDGKYKGPRPVLKR
tara:strand:+ start:65 stop:358 length:294 start_codon:yes stop_codon:yes gene_type:complete